MPFLCSNVSGTISRTVHHAATFQLTHDARRQTARHANGIDANALSVCKIITINTV